MKYEKIKIEDMLETKFVKDPNEESGFTLGCYIDRITLYGYYLKAKKGSLLERIENLAVTKFQLENDSENFRQLARLQFWLSVQKYYDRFGFDENVKPDGFIYTDVRYKLMDIAKLAKSNVSVCDRSTGKYHINKNESYEKKFIEEIDKIRNQKDERFISELYGNTEEDEYMNEFRKWLNENMDNILTKKQADYLRGDFIVNDVSSVWRLNKNIASRVEKAYAQSKAREERIRKLNKRLKNIQDVLDFTNEDEFIKNIIKLEKNKSGLLVEIYEDLSIGYSKILTNIIHSKGEHRANKDFYYDIITILTYKELDLKTKIEELERMDG